MPNPPDDSTLLGYLLNALEPDDMEAVRIALESSPDVRSRLLALKALLDPLAEDKEVYEPKADLVDRTLAQLPVVVSDTSSGELADKSGANSRERLSLPSRLDLVRFDSSLLDVVIATVACLAALALLFPGILGSRELARRDGCCENLRSLGNALASFADRNAQRRLPELEASGPLAFAGVYSIRLNECGLLEKPESRVCPSYQADLVTDSQIPSSESLRTMNLKELFVVQRTAGGTYAFNMGCRTKESLRPFPMSGRPNIAVMADAPIDDENGEIRSPHPGDCFNMLFEDGRVWTIRIDRQSVFPDHPFLNRQGMPEAGVDLEDASLGPSYLPPLRLISR